MGFFKSITKPSSKKSSAIVSDVSPASGVVSNTDGNISDDSYVAPDLETAVSEAESAMAGAEARAMEEEATWETKAAEQPTQETTTTDLSTNQESEDDKKIASTDQSENKIDVESIEDGYVNADIVPQPSEDSNFDFNGEKGTVQQPQYKDVFYSILFVLHFGITIWWYVYSFIPKKNKNNGKYYYKMHVGLVSYVFLTALSGLVLSGVCFGYILRHGDTVLKRTIVFALVLSAGLGVIGLLIGEMTVMISGLVTLAVLFLYTSMVWKRTPFTAINLSVAVNAVRDNIGLFLVALCVSGVGFVWLSIHVCACTVAHASFGNWSLVFTIFSYYWVLQVLSNVVSVATTGIIGRWFLIGEKTASLNTGTKEMFNKASTHYFGSICYGSLYFGIFQIIQGLSSFFSYHNVPVLPAIFEWFLSKISVANEWAFVYVGLYGYSYKSAGSNVSTMFRNKGLADKAQNKLAGNILFLSSIAVGLLTGFFGLIFSAFDYGGMWRSGLYNPTAEGFIIGAFTGFFFSSILLSVVTTTMKTIIVCFAESPSAFEFNHPDLNTQMEKAWKFDSEASAVPQKSRALLKL